MSKSQFPLIRSDAASRVARRSISIDWFRFVGKPTDVSVISIPDWNTAIKSLLSDEWDDYRLDARNEMAGPIPRPQFDDWNWVIDNCNKIILPQLSERIGSKLPHDCCNVEAVSVVISMVRLACVEAHFAEWVKRPFFRKLFEWLEEGHLPCGATDVFPNGRLKVF